MNHRRLHTLQQQLQAEGLDAAALMPGPNLLYISGIHTHASERPLLLLIPAQGAPHIIIPILEEAKARAAGMAAEHIFSWGDDEGFVKAFHRACRALNLAGQTIAVETLYMRVLELEMLQEAATGLQTAHADALLNQLRLVKDEEELAHMQRAIEVAEAAMRQLLPRLQIGQTEKQIARMLTQELLASGAESIPFGPVVSSGPNAASPHAVPTQRPIQAGELMVIDWGAVVNDYPADITRTFAVGPVSAALSRLHEIVQAANEAGRAACHPQNRCHDVDVAARRVITEAGYGDYFIHRTGHGLGLEIHEAPSMMTGNQQPLQVGMTFTVEPGLYIPNRVGIRIEDNVVITAEGCRSLTSLPRELRQIG